MTQKWNKKGSSSASSSTNSKNETKSSSKKRVVLGGIYQTKDGERQYIKLGMNGVTLPANAYINIEHLDTVKSNIQTRIADGTIKNVEGAEKLLASIEKDMGFGKFAELYVLEDSE